MMIFKYALPVIGAAFLAGCTSSKNLPKESFLSERQQSAALAKARPPQQYGFSVYPIKGGIAYSGHCRLHPNHLTTAKLEQDNIPVIKIRGLAKRSKMSALLDFTSPTSWLEFSTSEEFNALFFGLDDKMFPYRGGYNTGNVNAYAGVVTQLRIDNLFMENVPFYIRMAQGSLGPLARGIHDPHIDAVLGYDNLRNFEYVQIDLRNNVVKFSSTIPYVPHEDLLADVAQIIPIRNYGLAIEGEVDSHSEPIMLDFAGDYSFARGDVKVRSTYQVKAGHLSFRSVPTLVLPIHNAPARIGRKLMEPYIVTICNTEGLVYFERYPEE